jgi:hypothetical protein
LLDTKKVLCYKKVMDKKDIYEHLAKIYLDTTPAAAKSKNIKVPAKRKRYFLFAAVPFAAGVFVFLLLVSFRAHPAIPFSSTSLVVAPDTIRLGFDLENAKKQVYDLDLNRLNLNECKVLVFSLRNSNYNDTLSFRVEFTNAFKEKAEMYVSDVSNKWKEYRLNLTDFKSITDWSEASKLSFIVEEWNTRDNKGILYIDNVRFLK